MELFFTQKIKQMSNHTINILNKENNETIRSYDLELEVDYTAEADELSQLEMACEKILRNNRPNFDEYEWVAIATDETGEEVGRFDKHYISR